MSRLSFRPRPLDIHKKLPIVKSIKEFEEDEAPSTVASTRNSHFLQVAEANNEAQQVSRKKNSREIPTPQFSDVETYEKDYARTFMQPTSYLRGRGARSEVGEFVEYDLDNEDEDWLEEFNHQRKILTPEQFETLLFKLEVLDHKARERAGVITPTFGSPIPVLLQLDAATEALQSLFVRSAALQSIYKYWKEKRERWQKPILRHLQLPPPVNDTNPYNVFRPREKAARFHTRRMQRRENNVESFEKLRLVRRNLDQAKTLLEALIKREEKKRDVMEGEVKLQLVQLKYKDEAQLVEDGIAMPGFQPVPIKFRSSEGDYMDLDDTPHGRTYARSSTVQARFPDTKLRMVPAVHIKQELKRALPNSWLQKSDHQEPVLLFARPLDPVRLAAAGIRNPSAQPDENGSVTTFHFHGRIGRGGRIIFDRCNPLPQSSITQEITLYVPGNLGLPSTNG